MKTLHRSLTILSVAAYVLCSQTANGITFGELDDFQTGTTESWTNGAPIADPVNIANGGPLGAGDRFMQIVSDGSGAGGRLTVFNRNQWIGNYNTAAVTQIEMDLKNLGATPLEIRLSFKTNISGGSSGYVSTTAFSISNDGSWHHAIFDLSDLTGIGGPAALATFFNNPAEMRILHSALPNTVHGDDIVATLGVDNILAVPEPGSVLLGGFGAIAMLLRRRRKR